MTRADEGSMGSAGRDHVQEPLECTLDDVDGLASVCERLTEAVITPLQEERSSSIGASGVLIHGPAGVGKTYLAEALLGELGFEYVELSPSDIPLNDPDAAATYIDSVSTAVIDTAPCVLFIDDFDAIAPEDGFLFDADAEKSKQVISELCSVLDELNEADEDVVFIGTAPELSAVDERVRRPGRIDVRIGLQKPKSERRRAVIRETLQEIGGTGIEIDRDDIDVQVLSGMSDGLSIAELIAAIEDAAWSLEEGERLTHSHVKTSIDETSGSLQEEEESLEFGDFVPGEDEEDSDENGVFGHLDERGEFISGEDGGPGVSYDDIGGLDRVKNRLREVVEWPQEYPEFFEELDIDTSRGILLHGPPGIGKTLLAKAIASETNRSFLSVSGPEILDCYVGESAKFVRELFEAAREHAPSIIFIDEIDAIAGHRGGYSGGAQVRDSIVNQFLSEMDGLTDHEDVIVIGATNRVEVIDPALRRPGRFGAELAVPVPSVEARQDIFEIHTSNRKLADSVDLEWLAEQTANYTGADIAEICEQAAMSALREQVETTDNPGEDIVIGTDAFEQALETVEPGQERRDGQSDDSGRAFL